MEKTICAYSSGRNHAPTLLASSIISSPTVSPTPDQSLPLSVMVVALNGLLFRSALCLLDVLRTVLDLLMRRRGRQRRGARNPANDERRGQDACRHGSNHDEDDREDGTT